MFVIQIVDVYGESLRILMPSVFWNIGGLGEFSDGVNRCLPVTSLSP